MKRRSFVALTVSVIFILCQAQKALSFDSSKQEFAAISKRIEQSSATENDFAKLTSIVTSEPGNVQANYLLAQYLEQKGFEQLALDALDRTIQGDPNFGLAHYRRCLILFRTIEPVEALKEVTICRRLLASDGERLFQLGLALEHSGQKDTARQLFQAAAQAGHKGEGYGSDLAQIRLSQRKVKEAMEAVEWDLKADPQNVRANMVKADILVRMGRPDDAFSCLITAARSSPCERSCASVVTEKLLAGKRYEDALGTALLDLLCFKKDAKAMEKSKLKVLDLLKRLPDSKSQPIVMSTANVVDKSMRCRFFRLALADVYDRLAHPFRAIEQYQLAVHSCPAPSSDDLTLARGYYRLGRDYELWLRNYHEALDLYRRANTLAPSDPEIASNYMRLKRRMANRENDYAWRIKDAWYSFWRALLPVQQN